MEEQRPSSTALAAAMFRAAHLLLDVPPKIFEDTLALRLCGCENEGALRVQLDRLAEEIARRTNPDFARIALRYLRAVVVMRSRYVEDKVDQAIRRGVTQYVILGAGLARSGRYRCLRIRSENPGLGCFCAKAGQNW